MFQVLYVILVVVEIPWVLTIQKSLREESVHDAAGVFADFLNSMKKVEQSGSMTACKHYFAKECIQS